MATGETPVMDAITDINAVSLARTDLDARSLLLVRIAALVAVDAPIASYLLHVGPASDVGLTVDDVEDVLVAVPPCATGTLHPTKSSALRTRQSRKPLAHGWPRSTSGRVRSRQRMIRPTPPKHVRVPCSMERCERW
ncbi:hypothetical protein BJ997_000576 [Cryobacterium roopkundense]|uniref:Carboxymuconolactone decarboxylase-like domain-containing protein n=1 Tax=Cryobacterium roopkundense TaxID=1001240 RepID=A0A7W9E2F5_9MICO|nr:hypothetical protein [Cryobacterium roopkundense]